MFIASKKATRHESREPPKLATKGGADGQLAKKNSRVTERSWEEEGYRGKMASSERENE